MKGDRITTLALEKKVYFFKCKDIWFSEYPYDISGCHSVSFLSCKNNVDQKGFQRAEFTTLVIDLANDLGKIWDKMDKKSCRYWINRATREGIEVFQNQDHSQFYELNSRFRNEKGLARSFISQFILKEVGTLFTAHHNGEVIGGQLYLEDEDNIRALLWASKRLEVGRDMATLIACGNRLMIWEALKYAKAKGIRWFDLGGYYTGSEKDEQKERINSFKKGFGGDIVTFYNYSKDYSPLYKLSKKFYMRIFRPEHSV